MLTKHEIIARAFARREEFFDNDNQLSLCIYRSHQDPVGEHVNLLSLFILHFFSYNNVRLFT